MGRPLFITVIALVLGYICFAHVGAAAAADFAWASKGGGTGTDQAQRIAAFADGSSVVTGTFSGTAAFGTTTLTSSGGTDVFVAKLNRDGTYAWAVRAGGEAYDTGNAVAAFPDGSAVVTGSFRRSATFGAITLTPTGGSSNSDVFVAKIGPDGTFAWATKAGGVADGDEGFGVSATADGAAIVTGTMMNSGTFGATTLTRSLSNAFVAKVSATGAFLWATASDSQAFSVNGGETWGNDVSALPDGSAIITGKFDGDTKFGGTTLTSTGAPGIKTDAFVAKLAADGTFAWVKKAGSGTQNAVGLGIAMRADGSAVVVGEFKGAAVFGGLTTSARSVVTAFTAKIDASGTFTWVTTPTGTGTTSANSVALLSDGSALITGYLDGAADFGTASLTSSGSDGLVAQLAADGAFSWTRDVGGSGSDRGKGIATFSDGSAVISGFFSTTAAFGGLSLTSAGDNDAYVAALAEAAPAAPAAPTAVPGDGQATVTITPLPSPVLSYTVTASPGGATCTITPPATTCVISGLTNGTAYTFTVRAINAFFTSPASDPSKPVTPTRPADAAAATTRLSVTTLVNDIRLAVGEQTRVTVRIRNAGRVAAKSVKACLRAPSALAIIANPGGTRVGRRVCFAVGTLRAGARVTRWITVRAAQPTPHTSVDVVIESPSTPRVSVRTAVIRVDKRPTRAEPITG